MENYKKAIVKIISEKLGIPEEEISDDSNFAGDLNVSKQEIADLILVIEDRFKIDISPQDSKNIQTVQDLIEYIAGHLDESS